MNRFVIYLFLTNIFFTTEANSESVSRYIDARTGEKIILNKKKNSFSVDKFIEKANYCKQSSDFICFLTPHFKFVFPKGYKGQTSWQWQNFTFCVVQFRNRKIDITERLLVSVWDNDKCDKNYVGSYLYSKSAGLQYISTTYKLQNQQFEWLAAENKGFGAN